MVTYIPASGYASLKVIISDHATPGSATYALYCASENPKKAWAMGEFKKEAANAAVTFMIKGYILNSVWELSTILQNSTDWENFEKAIHYWERNNKALYLSVKNEWNTNFAQYCTYAAPTTLVQMFGKIGNLQEEYNETSVTIKFRFYHLTLNEETP